MGNCFQDTTNYQAQIDKLTEDVLTLKRHIDNLYNLYKHQLNISNRKENQMDSEKIHDF